MLDAGASCNDAKLPDIGDPTEIALLDIAHEYGIAKREKRISERPFFLRKKWMGTHTVLREWRWNTTKEHRK